MKLRANFKKLLVLGFSLLCIATAHADVSTEATVLNVNGRTIEIKNVPAPKEIIAAPEAGYVNCTTVDGYWEGDVYIATHQECTQNNVTVTEQNVKTWISGYWECHKANANGDCTNWIWKSGHWKKTADVIIE